MVRSVPDMASAAEAAVLSGAPLAPTGVHAIAGDGFVRLTWTDGAAGGAITGHVVTASDGQIHSMGESTSAWVSPLVNGQPYSFTVAAQNTTGTGPASAPSAPVTPRAPNSGNRWVRTTRMVAARERATAIR